MITYNSLIKMIINKSFIFNKSYLINNNDVLKLKNYIYEHKLPIIINCNKFDKISYIEFEKYKKLN